MIIKLKRRYLRNKLQGKTKQAKFGNTHPPTPTHTMKEIALVAQTRMSEDFTFWE